MCHFCVQNGPFVIIFFGTNHYYYFHLLALFIVQNLKKILTVNPELRGCVIFGPQMVHLPQTIFFEKN